VPDGTPRNSPDLLHLLKLMSIHSEVVEPRPASFVLEDALPASSVEPDVDLLELNAAAAGLLLEDETSTLEAGELAGEAEAPARSEGDELPLDGAGVIEQLPEAAELDPPVEARIDERPGEDFQALLAGATLLQRLAVALAAVLVLAITAMFVLFALLPRTGLYATYSVTTGSMEPAIRTGSVVLVAPEDATNIRVGDIIAVTSDQPPYPSITHRVTRVVATSHGPEFKTKGDGNLLEDPWQFGYNGPAGKVRLAVPLLGYALAFSGTIWARLALAGCIGLLLIGFFLPAIWRSAAGKQQPAGQLLPTDGLGLAP